MIITFLPLALMIFAVSRVYYLSKKKESITYDVKRGNICYSCKEDIYTYLDKEYNYGESDEKFTLCKSCNRDEKLNDITSNGLLSKVDMFKKYLYRYPNQLAWTILSLMLIFTISDVALNYYYDVNPKLGSIFNTLYWTLMCYKTELNFRRKKPSIFQTEGF